MFHKSAAVVEVGAGHVAYGRFQFSSGGGLRLVEYESEAVDAGAIFEPAWREHVAAALRAIRTRLSGDGEVTLILPPHLTLTKFIKAPKVERAKRERIVQFAAQQALPLALNDLVWASVVAGETDAGSEIMLGAVKRENVDALCAALDAVDFAPRRVVPGIPALLAAYRLVHAADSRPTALFDIGARSVVLLFVGPDQFRGRSFALGGPAVTDRLTAELLALRLKQEATRSLVYFGHPVGLTPPVRIVLTGGGARVAGLAEALVEKFRLPVEFLDLTRVVRKPDNAGAAVENLSQLTGAAALEFLSGQPALDLRPPVHRADEIARRRRPWLAAAGAVAVLAGLPPVFHYHELASVARQKTATIERELGPVRRRDATNRANLAAIENARHEMAVLQRIQGARYRWTGFLADLQQRLCEIGDVWLDQVRVVPPPTSVAHGGGASGPPMRLAVAGRMLDRANPLSAVSDDTRRRVRELLAHISGSPFVALIEAERFDSSLPGILRFDFVVVTKPDAAP
ncbi:MAG TPA: hypothetical protein VFJ90_12215 [Candidatus Didemnitutus sp.]|nr:hypothetical protein [Candidatus Didemnitutus sp.]